MIFPVSSEESRATNQLRWLDLTTYEVIAGFPHLKQHEWDHTNVSLNQSLTPKNRLCIDVPAPIK